jgi:hypothetical protein
MIAYDAPSIAAQRDRPEALVRLDARLQAAGVRLVTPRRLLAPDWLDLSDSYRGRDYSRDGREAATDPATLLGDLHRQLASGAEHFDGGQEQAVYIDPARPSLLIKAPYDASLSASNGVASVLCSALAAYYVDATGVYANAVPASLYWHASGYPVLIQERCVEVYGWKRSAPTPLAPLLQQYRQIGRTASGDWGVYDYDGICPFGYSEAFDDAATNLWCEALSELG